MPYFALRQGKKIVDIREGKELRKGRPLPLHRENNCIQKLDFYYEAQISVLVTGVDEWLWTTYCCVDAYFGCETGRKEYLDDPPMEPATLGSSTLFFPKWNPREFFLLVLSQRITHATKEWTT